MKNQTHHQRIEEQKKYDCMFYWRYDDGSYGSLLYNTDTGELDRFIAYKNRSNLQWAIKKNMQAGSEPEKLSFNAGVKKKTNKPYVKKASRCSLDELKDGCSELQKMFSDYIKDETSKEILSLFSLILSGYISKMYFENEKSTLYFSRAPIVLINKNKEDLCGGYEHLEQIARSLIVDTGGQNEFVSKNPRVIPSKKRVSTIEECAHARLSLGNRKLHFPTQYRDSAVLIHTSFFNTSDIKNFVERNRWCTILLFNKTQSEWVQLFAKIDLNNMALPVWNWDCEKVHLLISRYVRWLLLVKRSASTESIVKKWKSTAKEVVHTYNLASVYTREKIKQGSEWDMACLQIAAVYSFLQFLAYEEIMDTESCGQMFDEWVNILLPGSRSQTVFEKGEQIREEQKRERERKIVSEFELLLKHILEYENGRKVCFLKRGEAYPTGETLDIGTHHWAFLSIMKKAGKQKPVVKIRYEELVKLADKFKLFQETPISEAFLNDAFQAVGKPGYIHALDNARINFEYAEESKKSPNAVTLYLEKMEFLDKAFCQNLLSQFMEKN